MHQMMKVIVESLSAVLRHRQGAVQRVRPFGPLANVTSGHGIRGQKIRRPTTAHVIFFMNISERLAKSGQPRPSMRPCVASLTRIQPACMLRFAGATSPRAKIFSPHQAGMPKGPKAAGRLSSLSMESTSQGGNRSALPI